MHKNMCDGGTEFQAVFKETADKRGARVLTSPPHQQVSNGGVEKMSHLGKACIKMHLTAALRPLVLWLGNWILSHLEKC
eukprot:3532986-Amphidinium_carterae.1